MKPAVGLFALLSSAVHADLVITEVMASSSHPLAIVFGDWWELTNTGSSAVDLSGYKWDDAPTPLPPTPSIFPKVTIQAGESIIILQQSADEAAAWKTAWGLTTTQVVNRDQFTAMGGEGFSGLGAAGDQVNLYDPAGQRVAHAEIGASIIGRSQGFHRDGTAIHGYHSVTGKHGAVISNQSTADTGSPGNSTIHFTSSPVVYGGATYRYAVVAVNPGSLPPVISAISLPPFLTLDPGTAVISNNRPLTLADTGNHLVQLAATSGTASTIQDYVLTILNPSPKVILNEYNAVGTSDFLNGGTLLADDDGAPLSTDTHFGRVAGNGGQWVEFVVVGNGKAGVVDMRGWRVEVGKNSGTGFVMQNSLALSNHARWRSVPSGTILTFTANSAAQRGLDSGFGIRDRRSTLGDTWTNIWMGDTSYLTYTSLAANGYSLSAGVVGGITIDNDGTQFRVKNAAGQIEFGPVGEGVAPVSGTSSKEVFELENHPSPMISPIVASNPGGQGYGDGAADATCGYPNNWMEGITSVTQNFTPFVADLFQQWTETHALTGNAALRTADPDGDGRNNLNEYAFGGNPAVKDAAYPAAAFSPGALTAWSYVRRSNDTALVYSHEKSENLAEWSPVTPASTSLVPFAGDPQFSTITLEINRPVPAPAKWFLRAKAD